MPKRRLNVRSGPDAIDMCSITLPASGLGVRSGKWSGANDRAGPGGIVFLGLHGLGLARCHVPRGGPRGPALALRRARLTLPDRCEMRMASGAAAAARQ